MESNERQHWESLLDIGVVVRKDEDQVTTVRYVRTIEHIHKIEHLYSFVIYLDLFNEPDAMYVVVARAP